MAPKPLDPVDEAKQLIAALDAAPTRECAEQFAIYAPQLLRAVLRRLAETEHDRDVERRGRSAAEREVERLTRLLH